MENPFHIDVRNLTRDAILVDGNLPKPVPLRAVANDRLRVAIIGLAALLGVGAAIFVAALAGGRTATVETDAPHAAASAAPQHMPPSRKVRTTRIGIEPRPDEIEPLPAVSASYGQATADMSPLAENDPRWGGPERGMQERAEPQNAGPSQASAGKAPHNADTPAFAEKPSNPIPLYERPKADPISTAAISRGEERQFDRIRTPKAATRAPDDTIIEDGRTPTRTARTNDHVNLRTGPADEAKVIMVVPAKASVGVIRCKGWCEVVYRGNRGWIYKSFIGQPEAAPRSSAVAAPAPAPAPKPAGIWNRIRANF